MHSFERGYGPGIEDNDWLLGAEADSPDLNFAALTFGETRLRYLLFILYILFGLYLFSLLYVLYIFCIE